MYEINELDIELFYNRSSRDNNDIDNKKRENIIAKIVNNELDFGKFTNLDKWISLSNKLVELIQDIAKRLDIDYDKYLISAKAGRGNNYDFELTFFMYDIVVMIQKLEYKNSPSMKDYPECLSKYTKNDFVDDDKYHEFFYDEGYLQSELELVSNKFNIDLSILDIDRQSYINECCKTDSNIKIIELIEKLEYLNVTIDSTIPTKSDRKIDKKFYKDKSDIVDISITDYIKNVIKNDTFSGSAFLTKISEQKDKLFIFWDYKNEQFSIDAIDINNETSIVDITHNIIKGKGVRKTWNIFGNSINTIIVRLNNDTQYECLLRWKNHKGVLGPAWQIKYIVNNNFPSRFK